MVRTHSLLMLDSWGKLFLHHTRPSFQSLSYPEIKFRSLGGKWKVFFSFFSFGLPFLSFPLVMVSASRCGRLDQNLPKGRIGNGKCLKCRESRPHCSGFSYFLSAPLRELCLQTGDVRRPHTDFSSLEKEVKLIMAIPTTGICKLLPLE